MTISLSAVVGIAVGIAGPIPTYELQTDMVGTSGGYGIPSMTSLKSVAGRYKYIGPVYFIKLCCVRKRFFCFVFHSTNAFQPTYFVFFFISAVTNCVINFSTGFRLKLPFSGNLKEC